MFLDHGGIWLLELSKFVAAGVQTEQQRWLKFFNEAERLDEGALPAWMQTREMRQAMSTLKVFSEKERAYHSYQARQNYLREQRSVQRHLDDLNTQIENIRAAKEQERVAKEQARVAMKQERAAKEEARVAMKQERAAKEQARGPWNRSVQTKRRSVRPRRTHWRKSSASSGCWERGRIPNRTDSRFHRTRL